MAYGGLLVAVLVFSLAVLPVSLAGGVDNPFLFNAAWRFGFFLGVLAFVVLRFGGLFRSRAAWAAVGLGLFTWPMFWSALAAAEYGLFAWSGQFVDLSVTVVMTDLWPIFMILVLSRVFAGRSPVGSLPLPLILLLAGMAFLGVALVVSSQYGGILVGLSDWRRLVPGVLLALVSAATIGLAGFTFRWGMDFVSRLPVALLHAWGLFPLLLVGAVLGGALGSLFLVPFSLGVGWVRGEEWVWSTMAWALICGTLIHGVASICFRFGNLLSSSTGVNAVGYFVGVFSLGWLWLFADLELARPEWLVSGVAGILLANLLLGLRGFGAARRMALLVFLWLAGAGLQLGVGW